MSRIPHGPRPVAVAVAVLSLVLAITGLLAQPAAASTPTTASTSGWITDGSVSALARSDHGSLYVGGTFSYVGPFTGQAVALSDGGDVTARPRVNGPIRAVEPDGSGGWYLGGTFTKIGDEARNNLAHVLADGTVDPLWNPGASTTVTVLRFSGSTVYAGGMFVSIGGQPRNRLAALDAVTGTPTAWNPNANNSVTSIALDGSTVYAGGLFTTVGGQPRSRLVALDAATAAPTDWAPSVNNTVSALDVEGSSVYAGGSFTAVNGIARNRVAAIDTTTGQPTPWDANANASVLALEATATTVFVGGSFTQIAGESRNRLAALSSETATARAWNPDASGGFSAAVNALDVRGSTVYVGGTFTMIDGKQRGRLAAVDAETGSATSWSPATNGTVSALAADAAGVYAGGSFTSVGGLTRRNAAELDLTTGEATAWAPNPDGTVNTLAAAGSTVYVGGRFTTIGGELRSNVAAVSESGSVKAWNPDANNSVSQIVAAGSAIYVGGGFTSIGGQPRRYLAALAEDGTATPWDPSPDSFVNALAVSGSTVYAGGAFTTIGGQPRRFAGAVDSAGAATSWTADADGYVRAIAVSGSTTYVAGGFLTLGGLPRQGLAAVDASGSTSAWDPRANGIVHAIAVSDSLVYAAGAFSSLGGQPRRNAGAVDATGNATAWNPGPASSANAIVASDSSAYVGGAFTTVGGLGHTGLASFVAAPSVVTAPAIVGEPIIGRSVAADRGTWGGDTASFAYQWLRDGSVIPGATSREYTLETADEGQDIGVRVEARNLGGTTSTSAAAVRARAPQAATPCSQSAACAAAAERLRTLHPPSVADDASNALDTTADGFASPDGAAIPKDPDAPMTVETDAGPLSVELADGSQAAHDGKLAADAAVVYPATSESTDTAVRATDDGVETFSVLRDETADPTVRLALDLPGEERLVEQDDGTVTVLDESPPVAVPDEPKPADVQAGTPEADALRSSDPSFDPDTPDADPAADATVLAQTESKAGDGLPVTEGQAITGAVADDPETPTGTAPSGDETTSPDPHVADAQQQAEAISDQARADAVAELGELKAAGDAFDAERAADVAATRDDVRLVAQVKEVWAKDADGDAVPTVLTVEGDSVVVTVEPTADAAYPIIVDPWVVHTNTYEKWTEVKHYKTERYIARWDLRTRHVGWVHVGWCWLPGWSCADFGNGWWGVSPAGVFAQFSSVWDWYAAYHFYEVPFYQLRTVYSHSTYYSRWVTEEDWEWIEDADVSERGDDSLSDVKWEDGDAWVTDTTEGSARAAWLPAVLICVRVCPVIAGTAVKVVKKSASAARIVRMPKPIPSTQQLAASFKAARGSSPGRTLGQNLVRGGQQLTTKQVEKLRRAWTDAGFNAHHIVATGDGRAEFARAILQRAGIGPNDPINGVWLRACSHRCIHTNLYYRNVNAMLEKFNGVHAPPRFLVEQELRRIARMLETNQFPYK